LPEEKPKEGSGEKPDPIAKGGNPLHVRGLPRSTALSDEQKETLRKFLKIPPPLDKDSWDAMSKKDRSAATKKRSLPHWAVTSVLRDPKNLDRILKGEVTKDNFIQTVQSGKGKPTPSQVEPKQFAEAQTAWTALKDKYPGIGLFARPRSKDEKEFKSAYDKLVKHFGKLSCFPNPRAKHPNDSGASSPRQGGQRSEKSGLSGDAQLILTILKEVAGIFKKD